MSRARVALLAAGLPALGFALLVAQGFYTRSRTYLTPADAPEPANEYGTGPELRLLLVGDSSAVGVGATAGDGGVGGRLAAALAAAGQRRVVVTARAVFGARTADLPAQLADVEQLKPHLVVILVGANDATHGTPLHEIRRGTTEAVRLAGATGAAVVLGSCPHLGSRNFPRPLRWVAAWHGRRVAGVQEEAVSRAGGWAVPLDALVGEAFRADPETLSSDDFHPSDKGYALWAEALLPTVLAAVGRRARSFS